MSNLFTISFPAEICGGGITAPKKSSKIGGQM